MQEVGASRVLIGLDNTRFDENAARGGRPGRICALMQEFSCFFCVPFFECCKQSPVQLLNRRGHGSIQNLTFLCCRDRGRSRTPHLLAPTASVRWEYDALNKTAHVGTDFRERIRPSENRARGVCPDFLRSSIVFAGKSRMEGFNVFKIPLQPCPWIVCAHARIFINDTIRIFIHPCPCIVCAHARIFIMVIIRIFILGYIPFQPSPWIA